MVRVLTVCVLALALVSSRAQAWPWSAEPCCDKAGWYGLDGGPLSWMCFGFESEQSPFVFLRFLELRGYVIEQDYEAARKAGADLLSGSGGRCSYAPRSEPHLHAADRDPEDHGLRTVRIKGGDMRALIFDEALIARDSPRLPLDGPEADFVAWSREESKKAYPHRSWPSDGR